MRIDLPRGFAGAFARVFFLLVLAVFGLVWFVPAAVAGGDCSDGSCSFDPTGGAGGGGAPGGSSSVRSMERDWRTRLLLDNLGRDGFDAAETDGAMAPRLSAPGYAERKLSLSYFGSFQVSQYPPFEDWRRSAKDTEYSAEAAVEAVYPWDAKTEFTGRLSLRHEWSKSDPNSFPHYEVLITRVDAGVRRKLTDELTATLKLGTFGAEASSGEPDDDSLDPELLYVAELEYRRPRYVVRGGTYRDVFGSPDAEGYHLAKAYVDYLEGEVDITPRLNLNVRGNHLRFTDDTDDYESVSGVLTYYPEFLPERTGVKAGGLYEFRDDENETTWLGGIEWGRSISERNSLFASGTFYANTTTNEREVVSEVMWGHMGREGKHGGAVGISLQWEYEVYDRYSTFVFFRLY
jgi:hypothetical protein